MPAVTASKDIRAVELMAATDPGDVLIDALRTLGSTAAQQAGADGAPPGAVFLPRLTLTLTLSWE